MPATVKGSQAVFAINDQAAAGTLPSGNWASNHFYTENFVPGESLVNDPELGGARNNPVDPIDPSSGLPNPSGNLKVPFDLNQLGLYLKSLMGAPTTSGTTNYTHVFTSGKESLSALAAEFRMGNDVFKIAEFFAIASAQFNVANEDGYRTVDLTTVPRRVFDAGSSQAGTVTAPPARSKVSGGIGVCRFNATQVANLLSGTATIANGAAGERYADDSSYISAIDPGEPSFKASPEIRVRQGAWSALKALFDGVTPFAFEQEFQINVNSSLLIAAPRCFGNIVIPEIDGPSGVSVTPEIMAVQTAAAPMLTVTLKNQIAAI
jgi:hypothetical protein